MSKEVIQQGIWGSVTNFVKKHKSKIIITGVAAATVGGLIYYYYNNNNAVATVTRDGSGASGSGETPRDLQALTEQEKEQLTKRLGYLFEENRKTADKGIRTLLPSTKSTILSIIDVEKLIARLKQQQTSASSSSSLIEDEASTTTTTIPQQPLGKEEKRKIWEQLKIDSFTRLITSVYSLNLSFMLFSIQVNILGRYIFLLQQKEELQSNGGNGANLSDEDAPVPNVNYEIQQQFLSYAAFFQKQGINKLIQKVEHLVNKHIGTLPLSEKVTAEKLCEYMEQIRLDLQLDLEKASTNTNTHFLSTDNLVHYLLPDEQEDEKKLQSELSETLEESTTTTGSSSSSNQKILLLLLDELRDYLESKEIVNVLNEISSNTFNVLFARLKHIMLSSSLQKMQKQEQTQAQNGAAVAAAGSCFIANIIPKVGSEAKNILASTMDNEYLRAVEDCEYLQKFCAHVYSLGILDKLN